MRTMIVCGVCGRPWEGDTHKTEVCVKRLQAEKEAAQARADRFHRALLRIAVLEVQRNPDEGDTVYQIATKALEEDLAKTKKEATA